MQADMLEARNQLSSRVQAALSGKDIIIANEAVPVVRSVKPGAWSGLPPAPADRDAPETHAELADTLADGELT